MTNKNMSNQPMNLNNGDNKILRQSDQLWTSQKATKRQNKTTAKNKSKQLELKKIIGQFSCIIYSCCDACWAAGSFVLLFPVCIKARHF